MIQEDMKCPICGSSDVEPAHPHPDDYASAFIRGYCKRCGHELTAYDGSYEDTEGSTEE